MRDHLLLSEIEGILQNSESLSEETYNEIMACVKTEAECCLCYARSYSECICGAWEIGEGEWDE